MDTSHIAPTAPAASLAHPKTSEKVSEYFKGKDQQWGEVYGRRRPLSLLELPIDILRLIVKEVGPLSREHDGNFAAMAANTFRNLDHAY